MSEFGEKFKDLMGDLDKRESLETQKKNKAKVVTYKIEASGIDMMVTRILNGKETRTLVLFLSQVDENGKPVIMMKEKGKLLEVSDKTLASFLDGDLDTHPIATGCTAIPYLRKGAPFIKAMWAFIHSHKCIKLAKMGVFDLECLYMGFEDRYSDKCNPWFVGENNRWDDLIIRINKMTEEHFNNIHPRIVKYAVEHEMKTFNISQTEALKRLYADTRGYYGNRDDGREIVDGMKHIRKPALEAFIVLANRYDEPFAMKCMDEYVNDLNLSGLNGSKLMSLLTLVNRRSRITRNYNNIDGEHVSGPSLLYGGRNPDVDLLGIQFDKNRLWEYILYATCIGRGRSLDAYIDLWKDYLVMAQYVDDRLKNKYPEYLQIDHDIYSEKYDLIKDTIEEKKLMDATALASKICDVNIKGFQFRVLRKAQEFADEAAQNANCVASYITRCAAGQTIVGSFRPKGEEKTLLTVEVSPKTYDLIQIRGRFNRYATEKEMLELNKIGIKIKKRWEKYCRGETLNDDDPTLEDFDQDGEKDAGAAGI